MELNTIQTKIAELRTSESRSKVLIAELVVAVTDRIHEHNEVTSANAFLLALSPLNQKKVLSFLKEFSGHKESEKILAGRKKAFTKDGVKVDPYKEAHDKFQSFKASGASFWQWCVMEKAKPAPEKLKIEDVAKKASKMREFMQEALNQNVVDKAQAFTMLLGDLMSVDEVMDVLGALAQQAENATNKAAAGA